VVLKNGRHDAVGTVPAVVDCHYGCASRKGLPFQTIERIIQADYGITSIGEMLHATRESGSLHKEAGAEAVLIVQRCTVIAENSKVALREFPGKHKQAQGFCHTQDKGQDDLLYPEAIFHHLAPCAKRCAQASSARRGQIRT
jgi:hypothetical protein